MKIPSMLCAPCNVGVHKHGSDGCTNDNSFNSDCECEVTVSLDVLVNDIMDLARENRIGEAEIFIKDRLEKDVKTMLKRAIFPAASEITDNLAYLEDLAAQEPERAKESIVNTMLTAIQSAFWEGAKQQQ